MENVIKSGAETRGRVHNVSVDDGDVVPEAGKPLHR